MRRAAAAVGGGGSRALASPPAAAAPPSVRTLPMHPVLMRAHATLQHWDVMRVQRPLLSSLLWLLAGRSHLHGGFLLTESDWPACGSSRCAALSAL